MNMFKILVVEDDDDLRSTLTEVLEQNKFDVSQSADGLAALERITKQRPDLVIMDVVMPEMSGPDTFKELSVIQPDLPTIFVTGYDIHDEMLEIKNFQADSLSVLQKPYTQETLCFKIREVLDKRKNYSTTTAVPKAKISEAIPMM